MPCRATAAGDGSRFNVRSGVPGSGSEVLPADTYEKVGTYTSADAEATLDVRVEGQPLVLKRRPDDTIALTPRPHALARDLARTGIEGERSEK